MARQQTRRWMKQHGFTNGLWRLAERDHTTAQNAERRNAKVVEPLRSIVNSFAPIDPRYPDPSRDGIFRDHNCWKCQSGTKPCVVGNPRQCEYPHARND